MNNRKENEQSCIVMNKKEGASCITNTPPSVSTFTKSNLFFILSHQEKQELYYCCK